MKKVELTQEQFDVIKDAFFVALDEIKERVEEIEEISETQVLSEDYIEELDSAYDLLIKTIESNVAIQINLHTNGSMFERINYSLQKIYDIKKANNPMQ